MFASASSRSKRLTRSLSFFFSSISSGVSTRIIFPLLPLPYLRTHPFTVPAHRTPYFRRTSSKVSSPPSSSATSCNLNASLYRIELVFPVHFAIWTVNLFQDGTGLWTLDFGHWTLDF